MITSLMCNECRLSISPQGCGLGEEAAKGSARCSDRIWENAGRAYLHSGVDLKERLQEDSSQAALSIAHRATLHARHGPEIKHHQAGAPFHAVIPTCAIPRQAFMGPAVTSHISQPILLMRCFALTTIISRRPTHGVCRICILMAAFGCRGGGG